MLHKENGRFIETVAYSMYQQWPSWNLAMVALEHWAWSPEAEIPVNY